MKFVYQLLGLLFFFSPLQLTSAHYAIQDLGTLENEISIPLGRLNNHQNIAVVTANGSHIWDPAKGLTPLPTSFITLHLNNNNEVAGLYWHETDDWFFGIAFTKQMYILYPDGAMKELETPSNWEKETVSVLRLWEGNKKMMSVDFNDKGQILLQNAISPRPGDETEFAVWDQGDFKFIDHGLFDRIYGINNHGMILGTKRMKKEDREIDVFLLYDLEQKTTQEIYESKKINYDDSHARLNDKGQVIISLYFESDKDKNNLYRGFRNYLWDAQKGLVKLDFFPHDINNQGQIVGYKLILEDMKNVPVLWENGEMLDLANDLQISEGEGKWNEITSLTSINDNGFIAGYGLHDGKLHTFILKPSLQ